MSADVKTAKFRPLELNERNVNTLFKRCLPDEEELQNPASLRNAQVLKQEYCEKESETVLLSRNKTNDYRQTILFLFGQLKYLYSGNSSIVLQEGFLRYDDTFWTKDYAVLFKLYSLGIASNCISPFVKKGDVIGSIRVDDCVPTLSPRDPNFETWYAKHIEEHPELL